MSHVIQAEFFHVGGRDATLESVQEECLDRIAEGSRIKTTVRFYDHDDMVVSLVRNLLRERDLLGKLDAKSVSVRMSLHRLVLSIRRKLCVERIQKLENDRLRRVRAVLASKLAHGSSFAIENPDRSFRMVRPPERHEYLEATQRATGVWIFVFPGGNIVCDGVPVKMAAM